MRGLMHGRFTKFAGMTSTPGVDREGGMVAYDAMTPELFNSMMRRNCSYRSHARNTQMREQGSIRGKLLVVTLGIGGGRFKA